MNPQKFGAFTQPIMTESYTQKEKLGAIFMSDDGRWFRYVKAGAALAAGQLMFGPDATANHIKQVQTGYGASKGAVNLNVLIGASALTANAYDEGYLQVYDGAALNVGHQYKIKSHGVSAAGSEAVAVVIEDPLAYAIAVTDYLSLLANPWKGVAPAAAVAHGPVGVTVRSIQSGYYGWIQTKGPACCLIDTTVPGAGALGSLLVQSATSGAVEVYLDQDDGGSNTATTQAIIGYLLGFAGVDGKYCQIMLQID